VAAVNNSAAQVAFRAKELELLGRLPGINPNPYRWPISAPKGRPRHTTTPAACELTAPQKLKQPQWLGLTRSAQCLSVDELKKTSTPPSAIIRRTCT
jgi:hypothetical protein